MPRLEYNRLSRRSYSREGTSVFWHVCLPLATKYMYQIGARGRLSDAAADFCLLVILLCRVGMDSGGSGVGAP
jgi:hypothetical protein